MTSWPGIIASVRALIGVDELHARTEARYSGPVKRVSPEEDETAELLGRVFRARLVAPSHRLLRKQLEETAEDLDPAPQLGEIELLVG